MNIKISALALGLLAFTAVNASAQQSGSAQEPSTPAPQQPPAAAQPAQPAVAATGIDGKWHFVLETPGGDRESDAELTVDPDGKVSGKFGTSEVAGTYKEGQLELNFQFTSDELGQTSELKFSGKLDETNALTGTWEYVNYNGTFKATRPPAA